MSEPERFTVVDGDVRLDAYLAEVYTDFSRSFLQGIIRRGAVVVNGKPAQTRTRVKGGDVIDVTWPETEPAASDWDFESAVLHEDADLLFINKPSGLLVHPMGEAWMKDLKALKAAREQTLVGWLARLRPQAAASGVTRCGLVHRLDRGTSGVLAVAKTPAAQEALQAAWGERLVVKIYRALVAGALSPKSGVIEAPIHRYPGARRLATAPWGREARTEYKVKAVKGGVSDVEAKPVTGRTHQIRIHLAEIGHPVLGDVEYQKGKGPQAPRLMLHAWKLSVPHPRTGRPVTATAKVPPEFSAFWKRL